MTQASRFQAALSEEQQSVVPIGGWGEHNQTLSINRYILQAEASRKS